MQSGIYNYFLNGGPTGVTETFEIKLLSDGTKFTSSIRDAKPYNITIAVETIENQDKFTTCKINFEKDKTKVEAAYNFADTNFHVLRNWNEKIIQDETFDLPENAVFFPLMRCFQGQTILQAAENVDVTTAIVPNIQNPNDLYLLLQPHFDERTAKLISTKDNLRIFNYLSRHYDENSEFHIDENGLLVYYKFVQSDSQTWEIRL
jgi:hypothetical protein